VASQCNLRWCQAFHSRYLLPLLVRLSLRILSEITASSLWARIHFQIEVNNGERSPGNLVKKSKLLKLNCFKRYNHDMWNKRSRMASTEAMVTARSFRVRRSNNIEQERSDFKSCAPVTIIQSSICF
jgi:hypothetical protein